MNKNRLPVLDYRDEIVASVASNDVTIIKADTGAGKSTQVPQMLYAAGYSVIVTEPRRLAARTVAERIAFEMDMELGDAVGYQTAFERCVSNNTDLLVCTDGLQLVCTLTEKKNSSSRPRVLIIDEVHEWNMNIEVLIAWCKRRLDEGWDTKIVIMSATFEVEALGKYFGEETSIIEVPGRLFPVSMEQTNNDVSRVVTELIAERRNVLVFVPGKKEINDIIEDLCDINAEVFPLHGELTVDEQKKCFAHYTRPKVIVSTNVAQTSVTIDDIDAVVDTGLERRIEVENGIEGLFLRDISQSDCLQRKGRAGRTKEGRYILCSNTSLEDRIEFAVPEIQRSILDQVVLRLASAGMNISELEFFHQPDKNEIATAKNTLVYLGAMIGNDLTDIGKKMVKMPIGCRSARMIIEADSLGVVDDVLIIAAILETGGLIDHRNGGSYIRYSHEQSSDLLAELDIWAKISQTTINFKEEGINPKAFFRTKELINKLKESLTGLVTFGSTGDRIHIVKSCIAGLVDRLYKNSWGGFSSLSDHRKGDQKSCVSYARYVVGIPKTIQFKDRYGFDRTLDLLCMLTQVELSDIKSMAPHLFTVEEGLDPYFDRYDRMCKTTTITFYKGEEWDREIVDSPDHPEAERLQREFEDTQKQRESEYEEQQYIYEERRRIENEQYKLTHPDSVECDGLMLHVRYDYRDRPMISMSQRELFSLTSKSIKLPNGKVVEIYCEGFAANNIVAVKEKIENQRIKEAWERAERMLTKNETNDISIVQHWLRHDVGSHEITKPHCCKPEVKQVGYVCLNYINKKFSLSLIKDKEDFERETNGALKIFWEMFVSNLSQSFHSESEACELFMSLIHELPNVDYINAKQNIQTADDIFCEVISEYKIAV